MKKQEIFLIIAIIVLLIGSFAAGFCYSKLQTMNRYEEVLKEKHGAFEIEDVQYIVLNKK